MMKFKHIAIILGLGAITMAVGFFLLPTDKIQASFNGYSFQRTLTVANASSTQSNFPVLVSFNTGTSTSPTATDLKTVTNGGVVTSATGLDIIFSTSTDGSSFLPFEREKYASTTGESEFWVQMPTVANGQLLYMYYGKSGDSDHSSATAVWDSNFKGVWHLGNSGTTLNLTDSTSFGNTFTNNGSIASSTGQVDGSTAKLDGSTQYLNNTATATPSMTFNIWTFLATGDETVSTGMTFGATSGSVPVGDRVLSHMPYNDGNIYWDFGNATDGQGRVHTAFGSQYKDRWTLVTLVYDNSTGLHAIYLNGALIISDIHSDAPTLFSSLLVGGYFDTGFHGAKQKYDEVEFSNTARSSSWILTGYNNQWSPNTFWTTGAANSRATAGPTLMTIQNVNMTVKNVSMTIKQQ